MQFKNTFLAALMAALAAAAPTPYPQPKYNASLSGSMGLVSRQGIGSALVNNGCGFTVFVRSQSNTATSGLSTLQPGGVYIERFQMPATGGISIIIARSDPATFPPDRLNFEYALSGPTVFYDISLLQGNPFRDEGFELSPRNVPGCESINCSADQEDCLAMPLEPPSSPFKSCSEAANLQLNLCEPNP